ncbi:hypothetical protein FRC01_000433 [Tulasnella sp. 417]|nr:hypothetical protein FRC01_000433 [Tulasnella sp. 417]
MTGFIRIVAENPEAGDYMSKNVDSLGVLLTCTNLADAARVTLMPLMSGYGIYLGDFPEPYCWLGILLSTSTLEQNGQIGPESRGNLCPTSAPTSNVMGTSVKGLAGLARSDTWLFQSLDSCIIGTWNRSDYTYILQPIVNTENKRILAVSNYPKYIEHNPSYDYTKAVKKIPNLPSPSAPVKHHPMADHDGEECKGFIRQVRRKAFEAGKSRDKEWMADYAVSCFVDNALEWSMRVHYNVLEDWDVLQRALMEEYCNYRVSPVEPLGTAGTTAAAAPPPAAPIVTPTTNAFTKTGFVRIIAETSGAGDYMSKKVDPHFGDFPEPYCWLGIILVDKLEQKGQIGPESFGNLCPTSAPTSHFMGTPVKDVIGSTRSNIWLFHSLDSCIIGTWGSFDYTYILQPIVNLENKRILAVSNYSKYTESFPSYNYTKARLIFEPA